MVFAKKKWGQNFLVDNNLLEKIINTVDLNKESRVLEIGPGHGALSEKIALKTKNLTMVEIDTDLIQSIKQNLAISHFPLLNQDILKKFCAFLVVASAIFLILSDLISAIFSTIVCT